MRDENERESEVVQGRSPARGKTSCSRAQYDLKLRGDMEVAARQCAMGEGESERREERGDRSEGEENRDEAMLSGGGGRGDRERGLGRLGLAGGGLAREALAKWAAGGPCGKAGLSLSPSYLLLYFLI